MKAKRGLIFRAIPDNGKIGVAPNGKGGVEAIWPNCTVIPPDFFKELQVRANTLWFPQAEDSTQKSVSWIVNTCADADEYASGLAALSEMVSGTSVPVFNHPKAVAETRRDLISQRLQGIPNLIVPNCVRFLADASERFLEVFEENNFKYPVLVRPGASQTGRNLVKIDHADDWGKVHTIPWGGKFIFMTQFVDFVGDDRKYEKIRMVFANNKILYKSINVGDDWNAHSSMRTKKSILAELKFQKRALNDKTLMDAMAKIRDIVNLDFGGVDFGRTSDGNLVFFEANAAMTILTTVHTPPELLELMQPIYSPLFSNVKESLSNPKSWRNSLKILA